MSRDPLIISGGNAIIFGAALVADIRKRSILDTDPISREEGIKIGVTVKKNHCVPHKNPYLKTDYYAVFGQGIEQYLEALENAVQQGVLVKAGAFIKDIDPETNEPKVLNDTKLVWQGKENFRNYLKNNPEYFEELKQRIRGEAVQLSKEEVTEALNIDDVLKKTLGEEAVAEITTGTEPKGKKGKK